MMTIALLFGLYIVASVAFMLFQSYEAAQDRRDAQNERERLENKLVALVDQAALVTAQNLEESRNHRGKVTYVEDRPTRIREEGDDEE